MTRSGISLGLALAIGLIIPGSGFLARDGAAGAWRDDAAPAPARYDASVFRGGPARTGDLGDLKLPARGQLRLQIDFDQGVHGPVIADGIVYVTGNDGSLFAVRLANTTVLWQDDGKGDQLFSAPTVVGDRLYVATKSGLSARRRADGKLLWNYKIDHGAIGSSPLAVGGRILVAGDDGSIHAVNPDGTLSWKHDLVGDAPPSPPGFDQERGVRTGHAARPGTMAGDGSIVVVPIFDQSRVVAVDPATGKRLWSFQSKGWIHAEPTVAGDDVFVTSQDKSLYCLDKATGKVRWSVETGWRVESGVAVRGGSAYFGSCDGSFYRVDVATGKVVWSFETPRGTDGKHFPIYCSPLVDDSTVCFGSFDGWVYALKTADGTLRWRVCPIPGAEVDTSPCTDGRLIYVGVRADPFKKTGADALVGIGDVPAR